MQLGVETRWALIDIDVVCAALDIFKAAKQLGDVDRLLHSSALKWVLS